MAENDPYETLGVKREATEKEIRAAYRRLAKKHHPDLNPGNKAAEERFKALSAAYDILSDPEKRGRYDRGEIDASGQERPERHFYRGFAEGAQGGKYRPGAAGGRGAFSEEDLGDLFGDFFAGRGGQAGEQGPWGRVQMRGRDRLYALEVQFLDAVTGATRRLSLPDGRTIDVRVPAGIEDGQTLRLQGQGDPGLNGGPAGDARIEIRIAPHEFFRREGDDIHVEIPVTLREAVLGGRITVPTPTGPVSMTVPPHSDSGTKLRLRGRGVAAHGGKQAGDEYVTLKIVIGRPDAALEEFLRGWEAGREHDPRRPMTEAS